MHTPGPWVAFGSGVMGDRGLPVADCFVAPRGEGEMDANARLIAAAPALLDALRGVLTPMGHTDTCMAMRRMVGIDALCTSGCSQIRAAIAAAIGEEALS